MQKQRKKRETNLFQFFFVLALYLLPFPFHSALAFARANLPTLFPFRTCYIFERGEGGWAIFSAGNYFVT